MKKNFSSKMICFLLTILMLIPSVSVFAQTEDTNNNYIRAYEEVERTDVGQTEKSGEETIGEETTEPEEGKPGEPEEDKPGEPEEDKPGEPGDEKKEFTVVFVDDDGKNLFEPQNIIYGETATNPGNPEEREEYEFVGWYLDGEAYEFTEQVNADLKLVAKWKTIEPEINDEQNDPLYDEDSIGVYYYESWDDWYNRDKNEYKPVFDKADKNGRVVILSIDELLEKYDRVFKKEGHCNDGWYLVGEETEIEPEPDTQPNYKEGHEKELKESIDVIPQWSKAEIEDSETENICICTDVLYYDKGLGNWNTQNTNIPLIRNLTEYGVNGQEEMQMRVSLDFCEFAQFLTCCPEEIDFEIEELKQEGKDHDFKVNTNFSVDIKLPVGLEYTGQIDFSMKQGSLFTIDKGSITYNTSANTINVPIIFTNKYDGDINAHIRLLEDLKQSITFEDDCCYRLTGFIDLNVSTNDKSSGYMTTFVEGKGSFEINETCRCLPCGTETFNLTLEVCCLHQEIEKEDFIIHNEFLIDVGASSADDYWNKFESVIEDYYCKPTLTV
ncbi:MAG: InlB B-repeat-containing protein [Tissierellia bacterium]|nr:InlB B-repeat-containing protein [Tissierellia bacterium]